MVLHKAVFSSDISSYFKRSRNEETLASRSSDVLSPSPKETPNTPSKQRASGIDEQWKINFPWLIESGHDCERGFSTLNRVKMANRNRLMAPTLNSLLRVSMEGPTVEDFTKTMTDTVVTTLAKAGNRKLSV